ncbi:MAG: PAS domain-containing protein [Alphaproteobacteria bacterium]|nr:PAS domain-containing protein [Alphaproteobacteria bacterium]
MTDELLKNIVLFSAVLELILVFVIFSMQIKIYKLRRRVYFVKRDRERCNELLFSAKDGYFCFVYPDQKVKDPQKNTIGKCSRRLAVMLGLKNGTASSFDEITDAFYKDDAKILKKYVELLHHEGHPFEDMLELKGGNRHICVYGNRVNGADNNLYCDIVWFRDVTAQTDKISDLDAEKQKVESKIKQYENMIDGLNYPLWLRDENLNLIEVNKKYLEFSGQNNKADVLQNNVELCNTQGELIAKKAAKDAQKNKKLQKKKFNMIRNSDLYNYELMENPYYIGDSMDKMGTVGYLVDNTELEKLKRGFERNQNNHLEILGTLGTAFAIFDDKMNLFFHNNAFRNLWGLDADFLDKHPSYSQFLETVREHKMLPATPNFKAYRDDEISIFGNLWETKEDLLHLPDGRTIRRFRSPHPNGVVFAFEDVSDRLATMRRLNELTDMQKSMLDNLNDAVVIFGVNQRLKFYNRAYLNLWSLDIDKMQDEPKLDTILSYQKLFFSHIDNWEEIKQNMIANITEGEKFDLSRDDNTNILVSPLIFYDGSIMVRYTKK